MSGSDQGSEPLLDVPFPAPLVLLEFERIKPLANDVATPPVLGICLPVTRLFAHPREPTVAA